MQIYTKRHSTGTWIAWIEDAGIQSFADSEAEAIGYLILMASGKFGSIEVMQLT